MAELRDELQAALGKGYALEHELEGGGMSRVFVAHEAALGRRVVVKVLPREMAAEVSIDRFRREIQLAAQLQHPHIVPLLTAGDAGGLPYFTMPYVRGESLRSRLAKEGELPVSEAVRILREVALALSYAHDNGVVHRDIKPENILISGGSAVVTDFGVAKALTASSESGMTSAGIALGTPAYMAPEQATADPHVDHRADLYALGVIAYEMLTGSILFPGRSPQATLAAQVTEAPEAIGRRRASVPPALARLIMTCLEKRPADRPITALAVIHELDALTSSAGALDPVVPVRFTPGLFSRRRMALAGVVVAAVAIVAVATTQRFRDGVMDSESMEMPFIVVLPFENMGMADGRGFTDGMTEEIRSRLSSLAGLKVVGRQSAQIYAGTRKTPQQIADELDVNYLLTGTVRWDRAGEGREIVRVSPALIRASDAAQVWAHPYEAVMSGMFEVQSKIATDVASALNVALLEPERSRLLAKPTENVEAYSYYLRGVELIRRLDVRELRPAIEALEKAVALDPAFALAYAYLSIAHTELYWGGAFGDPTDRRKALAKAAADRALALEPSLPEGHLALAYFHYHGSFDYDAALKELAVVQRASPNDFEAHSLRGAIERRQGRWRESIASMNRAIEIEPRIGSHMLDLAQTHLILREYAAAERLADRSLVVSADRYEVLRRALALKAQVAIGRDGDLEKAMSFSRQWFSAAPNAEIAALDVLRTLWPATSDTNLRRAALAVRSTAVAEEAVLTGKMLILHRFGDPQRARVYADSVIEALRAPRSALFAALTYANLARAHAIAGRRAEALEAIEKAIALHPLSKDAFTGSTILAFRAHILLILGEHDAAIDQLEELLAMPSNVSKNGLRLNPIYAPLRSNPRFQRLVEGR